MRKYFYCIVYFSLAFYSCENLRNPKQSKVGFKLINKSNDEVSFIKIIAGDQKEFYSGDTSTNQILMVETILKLNENKKIISVDLKKFSKTGKGYFQILMQKNGRKDTLSLKAFPYDNFSYSNNSFPNYNTFEIIVIDKHSMEKPYNERELISNFTKYNGEQKIAGL